MKHVKGLLKKYIEADNQILEERDAFVTYVELIDELQEAIEQDEKENGWIPVSERLPEDEKEYLVTLEKVYGTPEKLYGIANYLKFGDAGYWNENKYGYLEWDKYSDGHGGTKMYKVIAWMPLPEPYKEVEP
jgi:hypothetical protein